MGVKSSVALSLAAIYIIWGSTFAAIKLGLEGFAPFLLAGLRFTLAGIVLLALAAWKERSAMRVRGRQAAGALGVGFGMTFSNAIVCWSELGLDSGLASLLVAVVPLSMLLLNWAGFERRRPSTVAFAGLGLSVAGLATVMGPSLFDADLGGELLFMAGLAASSVIWAFSSLMQRKLAVREPMPFFTGLAIQLTGGGLGLLALSRLFGEVVPASWPAGPSLAILYLALAGTVVAYSAYLHVLRNTTPEVAGTYALMNPLVALLIGVLWLGEEAGPRVWGGGLLILAGVSALVFERRLRGLFAPAPAPAPAPASSAPEPTCASGPCLPDSPSSGHSRRVTG